MNFKFLIYYYVRRISSYLLIKFFGLHNLGNIKSTVTKREILKSIIVNYSIETVVETGTYLGDTTRFLSQYVKKVYSIEIGSQLALMARRRFKRSPDIEIILGDSGELLEELLLKINGNALFFLDGHFSEGITSSSLSYETPLIRELLVLSKSRNLQRSIIVIDDAHELSNGADYPSENEIKSIFKENRTNVLKVHNLLILNFI
jgi:hypothetical protein